MYNNLMKKTITLPMIFILMLLCGCTGNQENSKTDFLLDTVVKITADCDDETLDGAFDLCTRFEKLFSRTIKESDVYKLNEAFGAVEVSADTKQIIDRSIFYSDLSGGRFDITIYPVSVLWDFKNSVVPDRNEIAEALKNVDYHSIVINENTVNLGGKKIDLGGLAKGYIADRILEYFIKNGVERGIINLGGNVVVFGDEFTVGIQRPFGDDTIATIKLCDKTAVTSGIYQRYIEQDGKIFHHIIDPLTGYGVENELTSVTVIGECSLDCDALSTVCLLLGTNKGAEIIENTQNTEAVFISKSGEITLTSGLYRLENEIMYK